MNIIQENKKRIEKLCGAYDPITGKGSLIERTPFVLEKDLVVNIPDGMLSHPVVDAAMGYDSLYDFFDFAHKDVTKAARKKMVHTQLMAFNKERLAYDFEMWAGTCGKIQDKESNIIPFVLNYPQRFLLHELETMRLVGVPIRVVLLKARQWGGSTLVQLYQAWMQLLVVPNLSSAVVTSVEAQARHIRGMFTRMADYHPQDIMAVRLLPYEGSKNKIIKGTRSVIGVGSFEEPENLRAFTFQMLHMSEVASWMETLKRKPENFVQAIRSTVPYKRNTCIVLESTAKGVGNFFHKEWKAAEEGRSGYRPVFIPWFWISEYMIEVKDYKAMIKKYFESPSEKVKEKTWEMWNLGATLEGINWYYIFKEKENYDDWRMAEEYPSSAADAFQSSGHRIFRLKDTLTLRDSCCDPEFVGEVHGDDTTGEDSLNNIRFDPNPQGKAWIWTMPDRESLPIRDRYVVWVDIGGTKEKADKSVIRVLDRYWMLEGGDPEFVFTWRGNIDHDILAWKAAQVAKWYRNGLLIVEDNSIEKEDDGAGHFFTVLDEIADHYPNLFSRTDPDKIKQGIPAKYGFHMNKKTKPMIIDALIAAARDRLYVERDKRAVDEMDTFERKEDNKLGAQDGCHDDLVITTAGPVWATFNYLDPPRWPEKKTTKRKTIIGEASM